MPASGTVFQPLLSLSGPGLGKPVANENVPSGSWLAVPVPVVETVVPVVTSPSAGTELNVHCAAALGDLTAVNVELGKLSRLPTPSPWAAPATTVMPSEPEPVSYTHLTLPTTYTV